MTPLDLASQHPLLPVVALIALVYLACCGGVVAARVAWGGRPAYWLAVLGVFLFLLGAFWGKGTLSSGAIFTAVGAGLALTVFGVALDLIFGPPFSPTK